MHRIIERSAIKAIEGFRKLAGYTKDELVRMAKMSLSTYNRRIEKPDELTQGEMRALCRALRLSKENTEKVFAAAMP